MDWIGRSSEPRSGLGSPPILQVQRSMKICRPSKKRLSSSSWRDGVGQMSSAQSQDLENNEDAMSWRAESSSG